MKWDDSELLGLVSFFNISEFFKTWLKIKMLVIKTLLLLKNFSWFFDQTFDQMFMFCDQSKKLKYFMNKLNTFILRDRSQTIRAFFLPRFDFLLHKSEEVLPALIFLPSELKKILTKWLIIIRAYTTICDFRIEETDCMLTLNETFVDISSTSVPPTSFIPTSSMVKV